MRLDIQAVIKIYVPLERGLTEMSGFMGGSLATERLV